MSLLDANGQELSKARPLEFAASAFAEMIAHLYPGHGFFVATKDDGTHYTVHLETPDALCGGIIDVKREEDGSDPSMNCSKCGRIRTQLPKPQTIHLKDEVGRRIFVPGMTQEN